MASKGIEMVFKLSATLGSSYNAAFKSAQKEITSMQNELQSLKKSQSDISAYQKQQQAAEATRAKLENLQKQHDLLQKEISETEGSTSSLEREDLRLQQRITDTTAQLESHERKLDQLSGSLEEAGIDTSNLTEESARLEGEYESLRTKQEKLAESMEDGGESAGVFGEKSITAIENLQQILVAAGIAKLLGEIKDAFLECTSAAGDFEEGMSNVEALSGSTGQELTDLSDLAKELGATTKFTAQEASDAMGYMAMAGWSASDMLSGMDGVMQLAAASGEDLATVSDIVTDNLSAFGLTAADTAHFSDVLAAAATNSNTSVSVMGETFKMSASVAGALGYSVEDVAVAVGLMANSGVKGSIAGTALKNTFNGLLEGVTLTGAAFGEYEYSAVQADGTMKDFGSTIEELRGYFDQMTEAERVNNAIAIAGERGYNGLLAVLNATDEDYASLTASINDCSGAAEKMASIKMDNMNGQITLMQSAWDGLKVSIGEQFTPAMTKAYKLLTDVLTTVNEFVQKHPIIVKVIAAVAVGLAAASAALAAYVLGAKAAALAQAALNAVMLLNPAVLITAGIVGLVAAVATLVVVLGDTDNEYKKLTASSKEQYDEIQRLNAEYDEACATYGETSYEAQSLKWQIDDLTASYEENKMTLEDFIAANDALIESHETLVSEYQESRSELEKSEASNTALIDKLYELATATDQTGATQEQMQAIIESLNSSVDGLNLSYEDVASNADASIAAIRRAAAAQAEQEQNAENYQAYVDLIKEQSELEDQLALATQNAADAQDRYDTSMSTVNWDSFWGVGDANYSNLQDYYGEVDRLTAALEENQRMQDEVSSELADYASATDDASDATELLNDTLLDAYTRMSDLSEAYEEAYNSAYESIDGQIGLFDTMSVEVEQSVDDMIASLESQVSYMATYSENLKTAAEMGLSEGLLAQLSDGSQESAAYLQAIVDGGAEKIAELNSTFAEVEQGKEDFANTVAEMQTDFSATMDEIEQDLADSIAEMDMNAEAAESGRNTVQGFIDSATNMLPAVQAAYAKVAQTAADAINSTLDIHSPSRVTQWSGEMAGEGFIQGAVEMEPDAKAAYAELADSGAGAMQQEIQAVAFAPQLMSLLMAAKTVPAQSAVAATSGGGTPIELNVEYHITTTGGEDLTDKLDQSAQNLREIVRQTVEEIIDDDNRRRY